MALSPDGRYLYIGNFADSDISILKVEGKKVLYDRLNPYAPRRRPRNFTARRKRQEGCAWYRDRWIRRAKPRADRHSVSVV